MGNRASESPLSPFEQLIQKYLDGELSSQEAEYLLSLFQAAPELGHSAVAHLYYHVLIKDLYVYEDQLKEADLDVTLFSEENLPIESDLPDWESSFLGLRPEDADRLFEEWRSMVGETIDVSTALIPYSDQILQKQESPPQKKPQVVFSRFSAALVLFGVLCGLMAIYREFWPQSSDRAGVVASKDILAEITAVAAPEVPDGAPALRPGRLLGKESVELVSGMVELRMKNGVRIVLEGPISFNVQTASTTFCRDGRVSVEVPRGAEGFEVKTPLMDVRDLGTEFTVDAAPEECEVHVVKGLVEIDRMEGDRKTVGEGYAVIARTGNVFTQAIADMSRYISAQKMNDAAEHYRNRRLAEWRQTQSRYSNDPALLFHLGFVGRPLGFEPEHEPDILEAVGMKSAPGRWKEHNAAAFGGGDNVLYLRNAPGSFDSFTVFASVRLNNFKQASNVVFSVGDTDRGAIHWQINRFGQIQIFLAETDGNLIDYTSKQAFLNRDTAVWVGMATVVDADKGTITHYFDGYPIATFSRSSKTSFEFTDAELGNRTSRDRRPVQRHFNGRIDEFLLLGRAATDEEIEHLTSLIR